ncbi:hypothetical protein Hypma_008639 [Hypsizygus marmoreus]|uniref:F-box domain-containing protein n=1 Tax=Hypsizygus marmoreus TaxID=39966 RepID=A0A369JTZ9_HYPMA|nr:hypothetical protein Hypma_008639 [Hypsizygus marmoreus]
MGRRLASFPLVPPGHKNSNVREEIQSRPRSMERKRGLVELSSGKDPRAAKRRKAGNHVAPQPGKKLRWMRGRLQLFAEFPLDILYEIFSHLQPIDLLRLTRSSKPLRGVLMQRSARTVWMRAEANVDRMPRCPPHLTEPAYSMPTPIYYSIPVATTLSQRRATDTLVRCSPLLPKMPAETLP